MKGIVMFETLLFSIKDSIATITFNRPEAMNSFNYQMAYELKIVTEQVRHNDEIRVVLLKGAGSLFMAGGDIRFFFERLETMPDGVIEIVQALNTSITHLMEMPKPVVASVHGSVAGVGMSFIMAADLVISAENTKFTMAYSGIGASMDGGASFNLPRLVGVKKAMEWSLLSNMFDAKTAKEHGLINWVVPPNELMMETESILHRLVKGPAQSYACIKRLINETWQHSFKTQLEHEAQAFAVCSITEDFKNRVTRFLQKKAL